MTFTNIAFCVPGEPQGKGRARIVKIAGFSRMATPAKTVAYEGLIAHAAVLAMRGAPPFVGPCAVEVDIRCGVPASWSGRKRAQALAGEIRPTKKPDIDNTLKAVADGINGVVWRDDVQAVQVAVSKRYSDRPGLFVRVASLIAQAVEDSEAQQATQVAERSRSCAGSAIQPTLAPSEQNEVQA